MSYDYIAESSARPKRQQRGESAEEVMNVGGSRSRPGRQQ